MTKGTHTLVSVAMSIAVVAVVAWGISVVGLPRTARLMRLDQRRLDDLQTMVREVQALCHDPDIKDTLKRPLPRTLDELAMLARSERISLVDPASAQPYGFRALDETTYELCATFDLERDSDVDVFWNHPAGPTCFTVDALDPP